MMLSAVFLLSVGLAAIQASPEHHCDQYRNVIVDFFGWTYEDIERECTSHHMTGVCAIQVPSPIEHQIDESAIFPYGTWYQRYRPVSYLVAPTDSGIRGSFESMIDTCTNKSIRVYADVEVNHMTTEKGDYGSGGSWYDNLDPFYPAVSYDSGDFNADDCGTFTGDIEDFTDLQQLRYCRLNGQHDLKTSTSYVRDKVAEMLNHINSFGTAGFRFAHSRFVDPADLEDIAARLDSVTSWPGELQPFIYQEVLDDGSGLINWESYSGTGRVEESRAGRRLTDTLLRSEKLANLTNFGEGMGFCDSDKAVVYIDDPSSQRGYYTGIENEVLTYRNVSEYVTAHAFMLGWNYGYPKVMSSYHWDKAFFQGEDINSASGPPRDGNGVVIPAVPSSDGFSCQDDWNCEHRWRAVANMIEFHSMLLNADINSWWSNGYHQIAFGRGGRGFIAINNEEAQDLSFWLKTPLGEGTYCDIITGHYNDVPCTGRSVVIDNQGWGYFNITTSDPDQVIALLRPIL